MLKIINPSIQINNHRKLTNIQRPMIKESLENLFSVTPDLYSLISREYNIANICITLSVPGHMKNKLIYLSGCDLKLQLNGNQFEVTENERLNQ